MVGGGGATPYTPVAGGAGGCVHGPGGGGGVSSGAPYYLSIPLRTLLERRAGEVWQVLAFSARSGVRFLTTSTRSLSHQKPTFFPLLDALSLLEPASTLGRRAEMIASHEPWPTSKFRPSNPAARECILLSTGAMNPIHRGHVAMIHAAADRLRAAGYDVLRAYVSPSHDGYVQPKARGLSTLGLSAAFRLEVAQRAVADDPLVAVGAWEAQQPGHWPDFPQVCIGRIAFYYPNPNPNPNPNPSP